MASIVIWKQEESPALSPQWLKGIQAFTKDLLVIANEQPEGVEFVNFINSHDKGFLECLKGAAQTSIGDSLIIINGSCGISPEQLQLSLQTLKHAADKFIYSPSRQTPEQAPHELPAFEIGRLCEIATSYTNWPNAIFSIPRNMIVDAEGIDDHDPALCMAKLLLLSCSLGYPVEADSFILEGVTGSVFDKANLSSFLEFTVNSYNIEELFPLHQWSNFEKESAAAAYHTLAAMFINLQDVESAKQCLAFSDRLEESPRSMALRALISLNQGETLGAVAHLVSSLQHYELRKTEKDQVHYLTFDPKNLEVVNNSLHKGLSALNDRNNSEALEYFAKAVFEFDSFYAQFGVDQLLNH